MRILFVANKYDYGRPEQGYSFEHNNFYDSLINMGHDVLYFDFPSLLEKYGKAGMSQLLVKTVREDKPDLLFSVIMNDELEKKALKWVSRKTETTTLNWFTDDHWRFDNYSRHWAPCFQWVVTTAKSALPKYEKMGYDHAIKSQWACNHYSYRKLDLSLNYDITFIGLPHGNRKQTIQKLVDAGIPVKTWGKGWETGRISQEDMIKVFNGSRINLNLSNASVTIPDPGRFALPKRVLGKALSAMPYGEQIKAKGKALVARERKDAVAEVPAYFEQIKGRNFEVPGCGGFMLTGKAEDLDSYYTVGKEIACFDGDRDLLDRVKYYLSHEEERASIAKAGYERTLKEHTYVHRFTEIFGKIGLKAESAETILGRAGPVGKTIEIE